MPGKIRSSLGVYDDHSSPCDRMLDAKRYGRRAAQSSHSGSRCPSPMRPDRLQQFALAGVSISKNGHDHFRQDFGVGVQGVEILIRADLIEHAFANRQIVRAHAGAIGALTQHLCEPFKARRPCLQRAFADEPQRRWTVQVTISSVVYWKRSTRRLMIAVLRDPRSARTHELYTAQQS